MLYPLTIFLSAFLLFQVQLVIGKHLLPWFGGTPSVWTTCMLFFQVLLVGGYAYSHLVVSRLRLRWQGLPEEMLWDYAPVGCLENTLQGNDRSGTVDVNLNIAKAVELALHDGRDAATGQQVGPHSGDPRTFAAFAQFFDAFG